MPPSIAARSTSGFHPDLGSRDRPTPLHAMASGTAASTAGTTKWDEGEVGPEATALATDIPMGMPCRSSSTAANAVDPLLQTLTPLEGGCSPLY
jgi:hypothetical protein